MMPRGHEHGGSCFVMMPYASEFDDTYAKAIEPAISRCGLTCLRADKRYEPGPVWEQIRRQIAEADLCVADLSGNSPNVAAEIGVAVTLEKPMIIITRDSLAQLPFDFRHYRVLPYTASPAGLPKLAEVLEESIRATLDVRGSPLRLLKEMLVPDSLGGDPGPFVITANPLSYREARRHGRGYPRLRGTYGDHLAIRGLIQAFGLVFGLNYLPDLINPDDYQDEAATRAERPASLYCIGSPKSNRWTGLMLAKLAEQWRPAFAFRADPTSEDLRDVHLVLEVDQRPYAAPDDPKYAGVGLLIRAPHPFYPGRMLMVLAGQRGLGTHAVSLAATDPAQLADIKRRLTENDLSDLNDHEQAFWVVAHMSRDKEQFADASTLRIHDARPFERR